MLQYSCLENPPSLTEKPDRPQSTRSRRVGQDWSDPVCINTDIFFWPLATLPQWELSVKVVRLLGLRGPWRRQVCGDTDCLCGRSYVPLRVFLWVFCSWRSESLFGQSFSVAPPVQALRGPTLPGVLLCCPSHQAHRGPPCLGSFSVVSHIRHIEGPPAWGPSLLFLISGT